MIHNELTTFLIVISYLCVTFSLLWTYPVIFGKSILPTASKFFIFNYFIFIFVGVMLMNVVPFKRLEVAGVYDTSLRENLLPMYVLNILTLPLFFLGAFVSNLIFNYYRPTQIENQLMNNRSLTNNPFYKSPAFFAIVLVLLLLIVFVLSHYMAKLDGLPFIEALLGSEDVKQLRSSATNNFDGKKYRYIMLLQALPIYMYVICFLLKKDNFFEYLFTFILFFLCVFTSLMDAVKSPVLQFILLILMLSFFKRKKIPIRTLLFMGCVAVVSMMLMYAFFMGMADRDTLDILAAPFNRIFLGSSLPMIYYLDYVPKHTDFLMGQSFPNPGGIMPFEWRRITVEIMNHAYPELSESGVVGSMPATFYGEFYVNFGFTGAISSMWFLGFLLKSIDNAFIIQLSRASILLPFLALFFMFIHIAGTFSRTTFMGIFFNANLIMLLFLSLCLVFMNLIYIELRKSFAK